MSTSTTRVEVFLGDADVPSSERAFLTRVRQDLESRSCTARIHANFVTAGGQRQVDFLVATEHRLIHVELKTLNPSRPLIAPVNGPWRQRMPGGGFEEHDRNYFRQAHQTTYSISDDMREIARRRRVPRPAAGRAFYTDIHTVVCVYPDIPAGSQLQPYNHVDVVGYDALLELLTTPGPRPQWTDEHWDAFARHLGLVPERDDSPAEAERRASRAAVQDYRNRFATEHRRSLHEYVPIPAVRGDEQVDPRPALITACRSQQTAVFIGPSGSGKSHTALHAALELADDGATPIWLSAKEYLHGKLAWTLSRAVAPFTTEACMPLLQRAADTGSPIALFVDGLNELDPDDQTELLRQVDALRLRVSTALVLTTTNSLQLPAATVTLTAQLPDAAARNALLSSYGRAELLDGAEAFATPMELAMACQCADDLPPNASSTDLFGVYIDARCPTERARAGLRVVAAAMDERLTSSLTVPAVRALLHRANTPEDNDIDQVMSSPLLHHTQGHLAFTHDLLARFLAAENLVLEAPGGAALAEQLEAPKHRDLARHAVALEHDLGRRHDLLLRLADPTLLDLAARNQFGHATGQTIRTEILAALTEAVASTTEAGFTLHSDDDPTSLYGEWNVQAPRTRTQQALLVCAGLGIPDGLFVEEVGHLLDVTDRRCVDEVRTLQTGGHRAAITAVVNVTYSGISYGSDRELQRLPASVITNAAERNSWKSHMRPLLETSPAASLWRGTHSVYAWGRLMTALSLLDRRDPTDLALLPELFKATWTAGGYHARLAALNTAHTKARWINDDGVRQRMRELLEGVDPQHIMLNSLVFEALAAYGGIEPLNSEDSIKEQIAAVLAVPDEPESWQAAHRLVSMVFEDTNLLGPYDEVLSDLDGPTTLQLHVMAARSEPYPFHHDWIMATIAENLEYAAHLGDVVREVVARAALGMDWDSPFRYETIAAHILGLRTWAKLAEHLPPASAVEGSVGRRAWRIVDELLFGLLKGVDPEGPGVHALWAEMLGLCAPAGADVLVNLRSAQTADYEFSKGQRLLYQQLLATWPEQMRELFEWSLQHPDSLVASFTNGPPHGYLSNVIEDLGAIGNEHTIPLLMVFSDAADTGREAVAAIRTIRRRLGVRE